MNYYPATWQHLANKRHSKIYSGCSLYPWDVYRRKVIIPHILMSFNCLLLALARILTLSNDTWKIWWASIFPCYHSEKTQFVSYITLRAHCHTRVLKWLRLTAHPAEKFGEEWAQGKPRLDPALCMVCHMPRELMKSLRGLTQTHAARLSCFHTLPCGFLNVFFLVFS